MLASASASASEITLRKVLRKTMMRKAVSCSFGEAQNRIYTASTVNIAVRPEMEIPIG